MATLTPSPKMQFFDANGNPLVGGKLYTYSAGTTTPLATYTDSGAGTHNTNPVILDSRGEASVWLGTSLYYMEFKTSTDVLVWTADNIGGIATISTLVASSGASIIGFIQSGAGAVARTLQPKVREIEVSVNDFTGADPTGATSSSAAIAAAQAAADTIVFHGGTWLIDSNWTLASGKKFIARDGAIIKRETDVRIVGVNPTLTEITATADMDYGSTRITLDAASYAGVAVGTYLFVKDRTAINADYIDDFVATASADLNNQSVWVYQVQTFKIVEKLAGNVVRVNASARVNYPFTGVGKIYTVSSTIEDVSFEGGFVFENGDGLSGATAEAAFFNVNYVYGLKLWGNDFNLKGYTGGIFQTHGRAEIFHNDFDMPVQLAVFLREDDSDSVVYCNRFRNQMTGDASVFIEAHNHNITVANNEFDGGRSQELTDSSQLISAVQIEAKATGCSVTGNNVNGYGVGVRFGLGAQGNTISGNTFRNMDICGIWQQDSPANTIVGNTFYNCGIATTPGTLAAFVGAYANITSADSLFLGNTVGCDSGKSKPSFYMSGYRNRIAFNSFKNVSGYTITNTNNRIENNTGDDTYLIHEVISHDVVRAIKTATIVDNVATTVFSIVTTNPSGSNDGGVYSCKVHLVTSFGAGGAATASMGSLVLFTVANAASGTQDVSAVTTIATTAIADPGGFTALTTPAVTLVQTSAYQIDVQVASNATGVVGTGKVTASIEIVWTAYQTPPVVS